MAEPAPVPALKAFSASMRVDALLSDWRAELAPELGSEERERSLYGSAWNAYLDGDYGFALWCWFECDRLTNAFNGGVREVTRVLGPGHYFGFSHRKAVAEAVPVERVYRPRKGDMSTPRTDAIVLPHYQALCVYLVRARSGDRKSQAQLEIALGELEERRRADPFLKHFETFRRLLERPASTPSPAPVADAAPDPGPAPTAAGAPPPRRRPRT
ncbi:MAG: hypothetical protein L3J91_01295 [Thermoplasmata archaeon]|nr:hypothetical protein [Thermoplasmata archaeon]